MKEQDFLIIGAGKTGEIVIEIINDTCKHLNIIHAAHHTDITDETNSGIVAIKDNQIRQKVVKYVLDMMPDFHFKWVAHGAAIIEKRAKIGRGTMIMCNATIGLGAVIGEHCFIGTGTIIEAGCMIGNFTNIGAGAIITQNIYSNSVINPGEVR